MGETYEKLEALKREVVDLVFDNLRCNTGGLTSDDAARRLQIFRHNKLEEKQVAFTRKKDFGKEDRELKWAQLQKSLHGLQPPETQSNFTELNQIAEEAKRRAEMARLRELHTLKGHVEPVVKLENLDIDTIQQSYTVRENFLPK